MNALFQSAFNRHFGPRFVAVPATEDMTQVDALLSLIDSRSAYAPSHPAYAAADTATRAMLESITANERLMDDLLALLAHGALLQGLELDPGSVEATLQHLAHDAAEQMVEGQARDDFDAGTDGEVYDENTLYPQIVEYDAALAARMAQEEL